MQTVLVILDPNHTKQHVLAELEAYHHLVTSGSYIVASDGVMQWVHDVPRGGPALKEDNPSAAALESARSRGRRSTRGSTRLFLEPRTQRLIGTPDDQIRDQDDDAKTTNERGELHEADASLQ